MWHSLLAPARPHRRRLFEATRRLAHSNSPDVPITYPAICVWGANTGVGKTLISAGLVAAAVRKQVYVQYVKPVQTGYPQDSDSRLVAAAAKHVSGTAAAQQYCYNSDTLYTYRDPVSPHLAAAAEGRVIADDTIVAAVAQQLQQFTAALDAKQQHGGSSGGGSGRVQGLSVVETAGGVTSPGPSGTLQGDILRPLALPALLVGDPHLGGTSTTLSSYESLLLRGHSAAAVVMMTEGRYNNVQAVQHHLRHAAAHRLGQDLPVLSLPLCKPPLPAAAGGGGGSPTGGVVDDHLSAWLSESQQQFDELLLLLLRHHKQRLQWLSGAAAAAAASVWWPFTQHAQLPNREITVVDARAGETWLVLKQQQQQQEGSAAAADNSSSSSSLTALHDAASSWWTQTAAGSELQVEVTRAVAAAAGRYMHVMWPQVSHAPGVELTRVLLSAPLNPGGWASRVFFSDDGSTAIEVALKMAFRKFMVDHDMLHDNDSNNTTQHTQLEVLALQNSYHGDTHGAMNCAAASPFNGRLQSPWYKGRGLFLDPPYLQLQKGKWCLQVPDWLQQQQQRRLPGSSSSSDGSHGWCWESKQEVLDVAGRGSSELQQLYHDHITSAVDSHEAANPCNGSSERRLGALLVEPVLQGAGGMLLVDPLFQTELVKVARSRGIIVIFDEVFTGCWRLGHPTAAALLGVAPDIACYAKLLTGGAAPLAVTVTSEAVFEAFKGPSKIEALLHGHSYTAYPLGCAAAMASLNIIQNPSMNPNVCTPALPGRCRRATAAGSSSSSSDRVQGNPGSMCTESCGQLLPQWNEAAATKLSHHPRVKGVVVLGSVLAVELNPDCSSRGSGYGSSVAVDVVAALRERGVAARPLGAVVYLMVTPTTSREKCEWLMSQLSEVLDMNEGWGKSRGDWVLI